MDAECRAVLEASSASLAAAAAPASQGAEGASALFQKAPRGELLQLSWSRVAPAGLLDPGPLLLRPPSLDVSEILAPRAVRLPTGPEPAPADSPAEPSPARKRAREDWAEALAQGRRIQGAQAAVEWPEDCAQAAARDPERALAAVGGPSAALAVAALACAPPDRPTVAALLRLGGWQSHAELARDLMPLRATRAEVVRLAAALL